MTNPIDRFPSVRGTRLDPDLDRAVRAGADALLDHGLPLDAAPVIAGLVLEAAFPHAVSKRCPHVDCAYCWTVENAPQTAADRPGAPQQAPDPERAGEGR